MKKIKSMMKLFPILMMGIVVLNSCEGEIDDLGSQFFDGNSADGYDKAFGIIAYNVNNNDTIRTDASTLDSARIGAFSESVFGMQKSGYVTQVRLNNYDPDFGKNPILDSVVLTVRPRYEAALDSVKTTTVDEFFYGKDSIKAKKIVSTYPMVKYGNSKSQLTLKVHEVNDFLGSVTEKIYSNKEVALGAEIGSKLLDGNVNSVVITSIADNKDLINIATSFRVNLDKDFFQTKIINKQGSTSLKDLASFIRYFKGISLSVEENNGYLFTIQPNNLNITMYYKNDQTDSNGTVTREPFSTSLDLGASNVHYSRIKYDRPSSYDAVVKNANANEGDALIYTQGMGGAGFGIKIPSSTISQLREMYKNNKIGITAAKVRVYNDESTWDNSYRKPYSMVVKEKDSTRFIPDMSAFVGTGYTLLKTGNLSKKDAYYDIDITKSIKNMVEQDIEAKDFVINIGNYRFNSTSGALIGQSATTRAYTPYRIVLKGTESAAIGQEVTISNFKGAQLRLKYTKK